MWVSRPGVVSQFDENWQISPIKLALRAPVCNTESSALASPLSAVWQAAGFAEY